MSKLVETIVGLVVENRMIVGIWGLTYKAFMWLIKHEEVVKQVNELIKVMVGHTLGWWVMLIKEYLGEKKELKELKRLIKKEKREVKHKKKLKELEEELGKLRNK